jgi:hypothetical protein
MSASEIVMAASFTLSVLGVMVILVMLVRAWIVSASSKRLGLGIPTTPHNLLPGTIHKARKELIAKHSYKVGDIIMAPLYGMSSRQLSKCRVFGLVSSKYGYSAPVIQSVEAGHYSYSRENVLYVSEGLRRCKYWRGETFEDKVAACVLRVVPLEDSDVRSAKI